MENVRLIIWDLDETFWRGTLTEGGIELVPETLEIVVTLAKRGIISSICSKNDLEPVKKILSDAGVWDYFVFPSVNWLPKGPRVAQIVEDMQLRAATILFIDDNPSNLEEVSQFSPGIQIASEKIIPEILNLPAFKGKVDVDLSRLNQYKMLEKRQADVKSANSDVEGFLRSSNIRVEIDHEVLSNIDRAIELINRTNQLNYTKLRLPDDINLARTELREMLARFDVNAGLIRVSDNYGDHGYCGLYITQFGGRNLAHFCFSCRILGMGVETWIYNRLRRPELKVVGDVLHNVLGDDRNVDWIHVGGEADASVNGLGGEANIVADKVIARGGCDLSAVTHYFSTSANAVHTEFNFSRDTFDVRVDHTLLLAAAAEDRVESSLEAFGLLGFKKDDFSSQIFAPADGKTIRILSFWADVFCPLYRHVSSGCLVPFPLRTPSGSYQADARGMSREDLQENLRDTWVADALEILKEEFEYVGVIDEQVFKENLKAIFSKIPDDATTVVLMPADKILNSEKNDYYVHPMGSKINQWANDVLDEFPSIKSFGIRDFITSESDIRDIFHFERMVYVRIYEKLVDLISEEHKK
jgi:FkbH-like protein